MPSDTARNWIKTARLCRHGGIAAQLSYCYSPQNLSLNPLMKQIVVKNPHNLVIQFILLQIPFREFRANLRFLFFRKSVQPPMIHALDRVNALEKQAVRI